MLMYQKPKSLGAILVLFLTLSFAAVHGISAFRLLSSVHLSLVASLLLVFKTSVEIGAAFYGIAALFSAAAYLLIKERTSEWQLIEDPPPVGIFYLCCEDFDRAALESLLTLKYRGKIYLIVHDDSQSAETRKEVDRALRSFCVPPNFEVVLLRRPKKQGGKSGAVNYILHQTGHLYPYFLLCDNDSTIIDPLAIEKALPYFREDRIAIVQCRSVPVDNERHCPVSRLLSRSIEAFHLFLTVCSHFGWRLFIGHNALLRTEAVLRVGGLTPGFFADDLDLTIRLNLAGFAVVYAPELHMGEKHPRSYDAFRQRTYKWSYGCMQMLKAHARTVLVARQFNLAEKLSFFYFSGFYVGQSLLLVYLAITFLIIPFYWHPASSNISIDLVLGSLIIFLIYVPVTCYFLKNRQLRHALASIALCGLVYGTTDFACAGGVWDCLRGKKRKWIPTNAVGKTMKDAALVREALFGFTLLVFPLFVHPGILYFPCSYLFAGKFLFGPAVRLLYRDQEDIVPAQAALEQVA